VWVGVLLYNCSFQLRCACYVEQRGFMLGAVCVARGYSRVVVRFCRRGFAMGRGIFAIGQGPAYFVCIDDALKRFHSIVVCSIGYQVCRRMMRKKNHGLGHFTSALHYPTKLKLGQTPQLCFKRAALTLYDPQIVNGACDLSTIQGRCSFFAGVGAGSHPEEVGIGLGTTFGWQRACNIRNCQATAIDLQLQGTHILCGSFFSGVGTAIGSTLKEGVS